MTTAAEHRRATRGVTQYLKVFSSIVSTFFDLEVDLLIVLDEHGDILRVNPAFIKTLRRREAEVLHQGIARYVAEEDLAKFLHAFEEEDQHTPFRLLRGKQGFIQVVLVKGFFTTLPHEGQRGFLILRPVDVEPGTRVTIHNPQWSG